ncbi:Hsp90 cochaperone SHQ1 NDAI_0B03630 [Naumovozyma dairenensis CBS 421]|uniref:CS domain-containing protein n=1 Tax=Naumovozyma dairenensis (strain ATCC 10597 / BCRC 20456 / CBS 421 / NBRC 0211 / NRRL Y-12639) TaxID=1071378 RepID=G0W6I6_NAUDC|nr:hypothetical protein NDAI_0B03630 [Naumovozyma dairenensis CBS 421]CCD23397.1 hypothetical protein NDAI_0B03630 [Naumovozyma dairenensis CBS 421]
MLTPKFEVTQDDEFLYITIHISNIRFNASGLELIIDENLFIFHLSPYYLRLRFPEKLVDDERSNAEFKSKEESIFVKAPKLEKGTFFEDLDFPTKLLARQGDLIEADDQEKVIQKKPLIQEVGGSDKKTSILRESISDINAQGEQFNWEIEQKVTDPTSDGLLGVKYGFNNMYDSMISVSISNGNDINELDDPEHTNANDRVKERLLKEDSKFDPEYYVSDYMINKYGSGEDLVMNGIKALLEYTPPLVKLYLKWYKHTDNKDGIMPVEFTTEEQEQMQNNIPQREYLIDGSETKRAYITLLNVLFGYVFEQLENEGQHNTESAWTMGKLIPQISFLDQQLILEEDASKDATQIKGAVVTGIRRAMCYPLHRHYELSLKVWKQVYYLLRAGKRTVIRALLDINEVFRFHDVYYVYSKILLADLTSWFISQSTEPVLRSLAIEMHRQLELLQNKPGIDNVGSGDLCFQFLDPYSDEPEEEQDVLKENTVGRKTLREWELMAEEHYKESESG